MSPKTAAAPLAGMRVLDLTHVFAGPQLTLTLAMLGAEVIRIEWRERLDHTRQLYAHATGGHVDASPVFAAVNHTKLSCLVNPRSPAGVELVLRLAAVADVVIDNLAPGTMRRLGLDYARLRRARPDIIALSLTGFGATGPYRSYVAYGPCINAVSGLTFMTGYEGRLPQSPSSGWTDHMAAQAGALAVMLAIHQRRATGRGRSIDLAMADVGLAALAAPLLDVQLGKAPAERLGPRDERCAPYGAYRCAGHDAWVAVSVTTEQQWLALCGALGRKDWARDARLASAAGRLVERDRLDEGVTAWTSSRSVAQATALLRSAGVPCAPCLSPSDLITDPNLTERGFFRWLRHPRVGRHPVARMPGAGSETGRLGPRRRAPLLGEHTRYILRDVLGLHDKALADYERRGAIELTGGVGRKEGTARNPRRTGPES